MTSRAKNQSDPFFFRLRWRCRRGVREMDLLLNRFLDSGWNSLSARDRGAFEALLEEPDPDILAWVAGQAQPPPAYLPLIERLREAWNGHAASP